MSDNTINLDAAIASRRELAMQGGEKVSLEFAGQEFQLTTVYNIAAMLMLLDPSNAGSATVPFLLSCIVPEDRDRFLAALVTLEGLDGEVLGIILNTIVEAVAGRPTEPSSDSLPTSPSPKSSLKSRATSSEVVVGSLS